MVVAFDVRLSALLLLMAPRAVAVRGGVETLHAVVAVSAEVPLVDFFLLHLIAARVFGKSLEMAGVASDAARLDVIIVTEQDRVHAGGPEDDVASALRQRVNTGENRRYDEGGEDDLMSE